MNRETAAVPNELCESEDNVEQQTREQYGSGEPLRVLVVTNMYPDARRPFFGTFVREQVEALRKLGVDVDVLFVDGPSRKSEYIRGLFRFRNQIARHQYDLVHAHYVYSGWIARMQRRLPLVVSSHGSDSKKPHEAWLLRRLVPHVNALIVTAREHQSRPGMSSGRIIPCGVDLDLFAPRPRDEARAELGWSREVKYVLYVGRDSPEKRLDIIRAAYGMLRQKRGEVELALAIGVKHEDIPIYMSAADVLVLASNYEGAPVTIKEAMACNLPIVSTDVGDVREVIARTEGCLICEQTPQSMAACLEQVLDWGRRTNGREKARSFSTRAEAEAVLAVYREVLTRRRSEPA